MKSKMNAITNRFGLLFALIVLIIGTACSPAAEPSLLDAADAESDSLELGAAPEQVNNLPVLAEGEVEPISFNTLAFQVGGVVAEILVEEGDVVAAGTPLIRLDTADLDVSLAQAQARLESAKSGQEVAQAQIANAASRVDTAKLQVKAAQDQLALTVAGARPEEIAAAERQVEAAQAGLNQAIASSGAQIDVVTDGQVAAAEAQLAAVRAQVNSLQESYDDLIEENKQLGPVEEQRRAELEAVRAQARAAEANLVQLQQGATFGQRSAAQGGVAVAEASLAVAEAQLVLTQADATAEQIQQAEAAVAQAEASVVIAEAGLTQAEAAALQADVSVTLAEVGVQSAEVALSRFTLTSPIAGSVSQIDIDLGELAAPGFPILTVADFSQWTIKTTDLTELDIAKVELGAPVEVKFDAIPAAVLDGAVTEIDLMSGIFQGDIVYEVTISLEETTDLPIRWGMTSFVSIE